LIEEDEAVFRRLEGFYVDFYFLEKIVPAIATSFYEMLSGKHSESLKNVVATNYETFVKSRENRRHEKKSDVATTCKAKEITICIARDTRVGGNVIFHALTQELKRFCKLKGEKQTNTSHRQRHAESLSR
jgi:hypothetical protein